MRPTRRAARTANAFWLWTDLAMRSGEMLVASAQVIGHRTKRMAAAGVSPSVRDRREFSRMGREKIDAAAESALAVATQWASSNAALNVRAAAQMISTTAAWMSVLSSRTPAQYMQRQGKLLRLMTDSALTAAQLSHSGARLTQRAIKPIHARATANARRLARG